MLSKEHIGQIYNGFGEVFKKECQSHVKYIVVWFVLGLGETIVNLEKENADLRKRLLKLERDADMSEQYSRRNNLRIKESLEHTILGIFSGQEVLPDKIVDWTLRC